MQATIQNYLSQIDWTVEPRQLYEPIAYALEAGGKRIRPQLVLMGCALFDKNTEKALDAAMAIEIFHNFTLLHDDVMDKADVRRGRPTVHKRWNENTAILSGDAMMIKAYQFLEKTKPKKLQKILPIFTKTALQVCEGQQFDLNFEQLETISESDYFEMIRLKTAVLLAASLQIGAIIGNATDEDALQLYNFGIAIGTAFQLCDDFLDVYGNPKTFGKKIGGDILCKKKSFLLVKALETKNVELREKLQATINSNSLSDNEKIAQVTQLYNQLDLPKLCENAINEQMKKAFACLDKVNATNSKEPLKTLATKLAGREK